MPNAGGHMLTVHSRDGFSRMEPSRRTLSEGRTAKFDIDVQIVRSLDTIEDPFEGTPESGPFDEGEDPGETTHRVVSRNEASGSASG
jgi:hypothetical protein